jgi:predicted secreted Zn-dependent protease
MAGETLVNVKADTIEEFLKNAQAAIREGNGEIGVTTYVITPKVSYEDKKFKKISFSVKIDIKRAHWSGGKADARHKKAIETAEDLNADHEEKHRKLAQDLCDKMFKDAEKDLVGKSSKEVDAKIAEIKKAVDKAYGDLDKKEGAVDFDDDESKETISVKLTGA